MDAEISFDLPFILYFVFSLCIGAWLAFRPLLIPGIDCMCCHKVTSVHKLINISGLKQFLKSCYRENNSVCRRCYVASFRVCALEESLKCLYCRSQLDLLNYVKTPF